MWSQKNMTTHYWKRTSKRKRKS